MSALDLFAMLNAPLNGSGAGAYAPGQPDAAAGDAFAGLLSMLAPDGDAAAMTSAAVRSGVSQAAFRPAAPGFLTGSGPLLTDAGEPTDPDAGEEISYETGATGQTIWTPAAPSPAPAPQSAPGEGGTSAAAASSAAPMAGAGAMPPALAPISASIPGVAAPSAPAGDAPEASPAPRDARPDTAAGTSAPTAAPQSAVVDEGPTAATPADADALARAAAGTPRMAAEAVKTAPQLLIETPPAPTAAAAPRATAEAPAPVTPVAAAPTGEAARAAVQAVQPSAAAAARSAEAPQPPAQPQQADAARPDRRAERREGETRPSLFAAAETGETPRPSVASSPQAPAAATGAATSRPGAPPVETRAEAPPPSIDPVAVEGEAAAEPARPLDSPGAAAVRDYLPTTLARAGVETTAMLSAQIVRRLEARSTRFDMVLTPEDLGRVDVRMEVDQDGQLTARLAFDNPAAAAELRGRADELRRQLEAAGFQMSEGSLEFAEREGGRRDQPFDQRERAFSGAGRLTDAADTVSAPPRWTALSLTPEGVDMKV